MEQSIEKVSPFIEKLLANPNLTGLSPLSKETQIIKFLGANAGKLYPVISGPDFFPGKTWSEILEILKLSLYRITNAELIPDIKKIITESFSNMTIKKMGGRASDKVLRQQLLKLIGLIISNPEIRIELDGPVQAVKTNIAKKYIASCFADKNFLFTELLRIQRLPQDIDVIADLVNISILLKPVLIYAAGDQSNRGGLVTDAFIKTQLHKKGLDLDGVPEIALKSGIHSSMSFQDFRFIEGSARLSNILATRCQGYNPSQKVDRGAESSDKSWFSIARKNYKYFGFDFEMVTAMYDSATSRGW